MASTKEVAKVAIAIRGLHSKAAVMGGGVLKRVAMIAEVVIVSVTEVSSTLVTAQGK